MKASIVYIALLFMMTPPPRPRDPNDFVRVGLEDVRQGARGSARAPPEPAGARARHTDRRQHPGQQDHPTLLSNKG